MIANRREMVHGIVLAGAHTWGGTSLDQLCSRPLLPLSGRPIVWHVVDWLRRAGITQISICMNTHTRALRDCLGDGSDLGIVISCSVVQQAQRALTLLRPRER